MLIALSSKSEAELPCIIIVCASVTFSSASMTANCCTTACEKALEKVSSEMTLKITQVIGHEMTGHPSLSN